MSSSVPLPLIDFMPDIVTVNDGLRRLETSRRAREGVHPRDCYPVLAAARPSTLLLVGDDMKRRWKSPARPLRASGSALVYVNARPIAGFTFGHAATRLLPVSPRTPPGGWNVRAPARAQDAPVR